MYCKDCKFYIDGDCHNNKLCEAGGTENYSDNDNLIYSYNEGDWFSLQEYFGCVHFKDKYEDNFKEIEDENKI